jgi:hypothetical protein
MPNQPASDDELMAALLAVADGLEVALYTKKGMVFKSDEEMRVRITRLLEQAVEDRGELLIDLLPRPLGRGTSDVADSVLRDVEPQLHLDLLGPRGVLVRQANYYPDLSSALNYAVLLLLDLGRSYGSALSRCQWQECRKFYFAQKNSSGGPANRRYCCPTHRDAAHNSKQNRTRKPK